MLAVDIPGELATVAGMKSCWCDLLGERSPFAVDRRVGELLPPVPEGLLQPLKTESLSLT